MARIPMPTPRSLAACIKMVAVSIDEKFTMNSQTRFGRRAAPHCGQDKAAHGSREKPKSFRQRNPSENDLLQTGQAAIRHFRTGRGWRVASVFSTNSPAVVPAKTTDGR